MDAVEYGTVGVAGAGGLLAVLAGSALFASPVSSPVVAAVLSLAALAGVVVAGGGLLAATGRLPALPVVPAAVAPASVGGGAVAVATENGVARWVHVAAGVGLGCAVVGFVLVAATAAGDRA